MLSGLLPHQHGVHAHSPSFETLPREETVVADLEEYHTVCISANTFASPAYGFDEYFDEFFTVNRFVRFPKGTSPGESAVPEQSASEKYIEYVKRCIFGSHRLESVGNGLVSTAEAVTPVDVFEYFFDRGAKAGLRLARKKLQTGQGPTLLFLNLMEAHIPYRPARYLDRELYSCPWNWSSGQKDVWELCTREYDEQYWDRRNNLYGANVDYLDRLVADFVNDVGSDTTVVVTSDHGDNLGTATDEGLANHKSSLSEGVLHVPLYICNLPEDVGVQNTHFFSHLQLPDLLVGLRDGCVGDLTKSQIAAEVIGMSAGPDPETDVDYWDRMIRCAYHDTTKIVFDSLGKVVEYELCEERPNWQKRVAERKRVPSWGAEHFGSDIHAYKKSATETEETVNIDSSTKDRLRELGYL